MRSLIRISAFVVKEILEALRQPRLLLTLVIGPFLILLVFGAGIRDTDPPLRTIFVAPDDPALAQEVSEFAEDQEGRLEVQGVIEDEESALGDLQAGVVDLVVAFPDEVEETIRNDEQAVMRLYHAQLDPLENEAIDLYMQAAVSEANQQLTSSMLEEGQEELDRAGDLPDDSALAELQQLSPQVLVAPFVGETVQVDGISLELSDFYAPGVVVVLLQHMLISLVALSVVRESELGTTELYRVAPLRMSELVIGKFVAYVVMGAVVGAALIAVMVYGLGVPMGGSWVDLALVVGAVLLASAGLGFCVASISSTDAQAVQYTMLLLLATIFLSGLVLSLERFIPQIRWVALALPPTYGIEMIRDVMLRGTAPGVFLLSALTVFGAVLTTVGWLGTKRRLNRT